MPTTVSIPSVVRKAIQRLRKKYPSVTTEVSKLIDMLEADERPGDKIPGVGYDVYKVRLPNPSAQRGKSGGFRVIYYLKLADTVVLVTIYSKTEQTDISAEALRRLLDYLLPDE